MGISSRLFMYWLHWTLSFYANLNIICHSILYYVVSIMYYAKPTIIFPFFTWTDTKLCWLLMMIESHERNTWLCIILDWIPSLLTTKSFPRLNLPFNSTFHPILCNVIISFICFINTFNTLLIQNDSSLIFSCICDIIMLWANI